MSKLIKISIIVIPVFLFGLLIGIIIPNALISDLLYDEKNIEPYSQNLTPINIDEYVDIRNVKDVEKKITLLSENIEALFIQKYQILGRVKIMIHSVSPNH